MKNFRYSAEQFIPVTIEDVFAFFSKAENLEQITPPWLNFSIMTPLPIIMHRGTHISYRLKLHGIPITWHTEITEWEPPVRFVDRQLSGPYSLWVHEHSFQKKGTGTLMFDTIDYNFRAGIARPVINRIFVANRINNIFTYRRDKIRELLG
jgi:ligand-binding SRPBCC domain-containing protein